VVGAFHGLSRARSDARRYPAIDPLDSWSKYTGIIDTEQVGFVKKLLQRGNDIQQMMTVVGEEGTSTEDFAVALLAEFFDNCYLQQNAFDEVDAATSSDRQQFVFNKFLEVLKLDMDFEDKEQARQSILKIADLFRNWNFAASDSDEYKKLLSQIDEFIATKGRES
ncbi:MAG: V-type ATP synthase subunit A, partial [bacterium]|nr:V-type ATP synthase subunit A [bacterium]